MKRWLMVLGALVVGWTGAAPNLKVSGLEFPNGTSQTSAPPTYIATHTLDTNVHDNAAIRGTVQIAMTNWQETFIRTTNLISTNVPVRALSTPLLSHDNGISWTAIGPDGTNYAYYVTSNYTAGAHVMRVVSDTRNDGGEPPTYGPQYAPGTELVFVSRDWYHVWEVSEYGEDVQDVDYGFFASRLVLGGNTYGWAHDPFVYWSDDPVGIMSGFGWFYTAGAGTLVLEAYDYPGTWTFSTSVVALVDEAFLIQTNEVLRGEIAAVQSAADGAASAAATAASAAATAQNTANIGLTSGVPFAVFSTNVLNIADPAMVLDPANFLTDWGLASGEYFTNGTIAILIPTNGGENITIHGWSVTASSYPRIGTTFRVGKGLPGGFNPDGIGMPYAQLGGGSLNLSLVSPWARMSRVKFNATIHSSSPRSLVVEETIDGLVWASLYSLTLSGTSPFSVDVAVSRPDVPTKIMIRDTSSTTGVDIGKVTLVPSVPTNTLPDIVRSVDMLRNDGANLTLDRAAGFDTEQAWSFVNVGGTTSYPCWTSSGWTGLNTRIGAPASLRYSAMNTSPSNLWLRNSAAALSNLVFLRTGLLPAGVGTVSFQVALSEIGAPGVANTSVLVACTSTNAISWNTNAVINLTGGGSPELRSLVLNVRGPTYFGFFNTCYNASDSGQNTHIVMDNISITRPPPTLNSVTDIGLWADGFSIQTCTNVTLVATNYLTMRVGNQTVRVPVVTVLP